jgi:hypothetical protein
MQEANIKNLQLDLIVNRHISEINQFSKEYEDKLISFINNIRDTFIKTVELSFQNFTESVDTSLMIYNSDNKLIQIKLKRNEIFPNNISIMKDSDSKSVVSNKSGGGEKKQSKSTTITSISGGNEGKSILFHHKINFGLCNRTKINFYLFGVKDLVENDFKNIFPNHHLNTGNKLDIEDYTINDILKSSEHFGENIYTLVNFFTFDKSENKVIHLLDSLNSFTGKIHNELFFDSITKIFKKIEIKCKSGAYPFKFDIFTTKHTNMQGFDLMLNIFYYDSLSVQGEDNLNVGR